MNSPENGNDKPPHDHDADQANNTPEGKAPDDPGRTQLTPQDTPHEDTPDPGRTVVTPPSGPAIEGTQVVKPGTDIPPTPQPQKDNEEERLRSALTGRHEIVRKLGAGGMANVYLAKEIALDRTVAIKVLPKEFLRDEQFVARFKREAQVAANLEHPHIVRIFQIGEENNLVYFVMSFIPGGAISDQIKKRGPLPVDDIVQWGMDTCSALHYAHEHGVIHRDLKPDNIMLDKSNRAVVMDFGIARASQGTGLTQAGSVIGTPQFMSPEQARGIDLDARSDLYSMGLVLYQMATATLPFKANDAASLMYMHVHEAPEPPDVRNDKVPGWLRDIILKCLAKAPDDRFANAEELRIALAEHKAPEITERTRIQKRTDEKKSPVPAIVIAFIAVAVVAGGWFWWNSTRTEAPVTGSVPPQTTPAEPSSQPIPAQPQVSADDLAFQQAEMIDTKQAYSTYLEKYPDGAHVTAAKGKVTAFEQAESAVEEKQLESEQQRREQQERLAEERRRQQEQQAADAARLDNESWQNALSINTRESFAGYLQSNPTGAHVEEGRAKLASLDKAASDQQKALADEQAKRDDDAYLIAAGAGTKDALSTYLISFPAGRHSAEAKQHIAAIDARAAEEEKIRVALTSLSITMNPIPAGSFQMGDAKGDDDEKPVRIVKLSGFTMSTTEITQSQYTAVMSDNPSFHKLDDNCPVERVTFKDAITFCNRLSEKVGVEPCYNLSTGACDFTKNGFRLPTEAEWECACRGNTGSEFNLGDGESALARAAWYNRNSEDKTHPVAQKTANAYGLYDMHGNVWEWTNDWYSKRSYGEAGAENPAGVKSGDEKVLRGGSWLDSPKECHSASRRNYDPAKNYSDIGFRVVRR